MNSASIEIVKLSTPNRGCYTVAVYETATLGWAANYGALETYNHHTRADALASLKLSLSVCSPCLLPRFRVGFSHTLRAAERGKAY